MTWLSRHKDGRHFRVLEKRKLPQRIAISPSRRKRYTIRLGKKTRLNLGTHEIWLSKNTMEKMGVLPLLEHETLHGVLADEISREACLKLDNKGLTLMMAALRESNDVITPKRSEEFRRLLKQVRDDGFCIKMKLSEIYKKHDPRKKK